MESAISSDEIDKANAAGEHATICCTEADEASVVGIMRARKRAGRLCSTRCVCRRRWWHDCSGYHDDERGRVCDARGDSPGPRTSRTMEDPFCSSGSPTGPATASSRLGNGLQTGASYRRSARRLVGMSGQGSRRLAVSISNHPSRFGNDAAQLPWHHALSVIHHLLSMCGIETPTSYRARRQNQGNRHNMGREQVV